MLYDITYLDKNLDKKPKDCAPHGLLPGFNCISYKNYNDLMTQINNINEEAFVLENTSDQNSKNSYLKIKF